MNRSIWLATFAALTVALAMPVPVDALDLGDTVRKVTKSVSGALSGGSSGSSASADGSSSTGGGTSGGIAAGGGTKLPGGTRIRLGVPGQDSLAVVDLSTDGAKAGVAVLSKGQLASLGLDANPRGTGNVSLPNGSVAGVTPDYARRLVGGLDRNERQRLQIKCGNVLRSPKAFNAELILLCRLLASL